MNDAAQVGCFFMGLLVILYYARRYILYLFLYLGYVIMIFLHLGGSVFGCSIISLVNILHLFQCIGASQAYPVLSLYRS